MGSDGRVKLNIDNDIDNRMYCLQTIGTSLPFPATIKPSLLVSLNLK